MITTDPVRCAGGVTYRPKCIDSELETLAKAAIEPFDDEPVKTDRTLKYGAEHLDAARKEFKTMKDRGFIPHASGRRITTR